MFIVLRASLHVAREVGRSSPGKNAFFKKAISGHTNRSLGINMRIDSESENRFFFNTGLILLYTAETTGGGRHDIF